MPARQRRTREDRFGITTAGALPDLPDGILVVSTATSPGIGMVSGTTVSHTVKVAELTGSDPLNRRVRVTSSLAPIMEDARLVGQPRAHRPEQPQNPPPRRR